MDEGGGGRGLNSNNIRDFITECSIARNTPDIHKIASTGKKLDLKFIVHAYLCSWALLLPLRPRHMISAPRPSLFFATLLFPCIILNANQSTKTVRLGNETNLFLLVTITKYFLVKGFDKIK